MTNIKERWHKLTGLNLYVWENVLEDYSKGMILIAAVSEEHAWKLLYEKDFNAWSCMQNQPSSDFDTATWKDSEDFKAMRDKDLYYTELATRPREIKFPEAFVIWGCN